MALLLRTIPDSDQSISDEDDSTQDWANKCATLGGTTEKKELLQISSRLEMLKGANGNANAGKADEDEVSTDDEVNDVVSKVSVNMCAKELPEDNVHSFWSDKRDELYSWSAASKEAEALMRLNEKTSCSSSLSGYAKGKQSYKGVKAKGKPKFSFRFQTHKEGPSVSKDASSVSFKVQELPEMLDASEPRHEDYSDAELIEDIQGEAENQLMIVPRNEEHLDVELVEDSEEEEEEGQLEVVPIEVKTIGHGSVGQSMAELLDGLQGKKALLRRSSIKYSRKRRNMGQPVVNCESPTGDRTIDSESSPEHLGHGLPSDNKLANPEMNRQTLADRFQEAMSDRAVVEVPKTLRNGLFGKLQQVVQSEKESDVEFLKKIQEGVIQNEPNCIDVRILSKYLDAKLTVCSCSFAKNVQRLSWPENPHEMVDEASEMCQMTIIFNPKVCNDVDLDVGKCIRIYPPWLNNRKARLARTGKDVRAAPDNNSALRGLRSNNSPESPGRDASAQPNARSDPQVKVNNFTFQMSGTECVPCKQGDYVLLKFSHGEEVGIGKVFKSSGMWFGRNLEELRAYVVDITELKIRRSVRLPYPSMATGGTFERLKQRLAK